MDENLIVLLEKQNIVTATFRKLDSGKKQVIYETAQDAFSENVFSRVSLDMIAENAAISKGSLFQYFVNKENLLQFTSEIFLDNYRRFWEEHFKHGGEIRIDEKIRKYLSMPYDFRYEDPVAFKFQIKMIYETNIELTATFRRRAGDIESAPLVTILKRASKTAEIRQDLRTEIMAAMIHNCLGALTRTLHYSGDKYKKHETIEELLSGFESILLEGIRG